MKTIFENTEKFYNDNPARRPSRECDYGTWTDPDGRATYRVSYVATTGEVYAARLSPPGEGPLQLLGLVMPDPMADPRRGNFHVTLDRILEGWTQSDNRRQGPEWVKQRIAEAGRKTY